MRVFVTALDEGSLAGAGRRLGRSPAAVIETVDHSSVLRNDGFLTIGILHPWAKE